MCTFCYFLQPKKVKVPQIPSNNHIRVEWSAFPVFSLSHCNARAFPARGKWHPPKFLWCVKILGDPLRSRLIRSFEWCQVKNQTAAAHRGDDGRVQGGGLLEENKY